MNHHLSDEQLDRTIARFLADRHDAIANTALSANDVAARIAANRPSSWTPMARSGRDSWVGARLILLVVLLVTILAGAALLVGGRFITPSPSPWTVIPASRGVFTHTGSMATDREDPTATLLPDGRVLVVGGYPADRGDKDTAEIWNPATGAFSPAGPLAHARWGHTSTLLRDGRVLVTGGIGPDGDVAGGAQNGLIAAAEVWDPATNSFTSAGTLNEPRYQAVATLQPDGRVLVISGMSAGLPDRPASTAELWDPVARAFSQAPSVPTAPYFARHGTALSDGRVLVAFAAGARIWDPTAATFTPTGSFVEGRLNHTATLLQDGRVLIVGGNGSIESNDRGTSAEIWDPSSGTFSRTGSTQVARSMHAAVLLADGRVLVVGNSLGSAEMTSAEIFELR